MRGIRWVHTHFKICGDSKRSDLSQTRIIFTPLLLIARGQFKSAPAPEFAAGTAISSLASQQVSLVLLWYNWVRRVVVEVIEHQVHVLFRLCGQIGSIQVLVIFIDRNSHTTLSNVTGCSRTLGHLVCVVLELLVWELGSARTTPTMLNTTARSFLMELLEEGRWHLGWLRILVLLGATDAWYVGIVFRGKEHSATSIRVHMHHVIVHVTIDLMILYILGIFLLPATRSRDWKVVDRALLVLSRRQHVAHAGLSSIEATQLRYLAFILLALVKLDVICS